MSDISTQDEKRLIEIIKTHILPRLDHWAITFKMIGNGGSETPRYSQLLQDSEGNVILGSTQNYKHFYSLIEDIPKDDYLFLSKCSDFLTNDVWRIYKEERTIFLKENHPTIKTF